MESSAQEMLFECLSSLHARLLILEAKQQALGVQGIWDICKGSLLHKAHDVDMELNPSYTDSAMKATKEPFLKAFKKSKGTGPYKVQLKLYPFSRSYRPGQSKEITSVVVDDIITSSQMSAAIECNLVVVNICIKIKKRVGSTEQKGWEGISRPDCLKMVCKFRQQNKNEMDERNLLTKNETQNAIYIYNRDYLRNLFPMYFFVGAFESRESGRWEGLCLEPLEKLKRVHLTTWFYRTAYDLLHDLHSRGAIHGDAHYGNFMTKEFTEDSGDKRAREGDGGSTAPEKVHQLIFIDSDSFSIFAEDTQIDAPELPSVKRKKYIKLTENHDIGYDDLHRKHEDVHFEDSVYDQYEKTKRSAPLAGTAYEHLKESFEDYIFFFQAKYMCVYDYNKTFFVHNLKMPYLIESGGTNPVPEEQRLTFFTNFFDYKFKQNEEKNSHNLLFMPFYYAKHFTESWQDNACRITRKGKDYPNFEGFFQGMSLYDIETFYSNLFHYNFDSTAHEINDDAQKYYNNIWLGKQQGKRKGRDTRAAGAAQ